jgi:hypothetical protein
MNRQLEAFTAIANYNCYLFIFYNSVVIDLPMHILFFCFITAVIVFIAIYLFYKCFFHVGLEVSQWWFYLLEHNSVQSVRQSAFWRNIALLASWFMRFLACLILQPWICCFEMSVDFQQTTQCYIAKDFKFQFLVCIRRNSLLDVTTSDHIARNLQGTALVTLNRYTPGAALDHQWSFWLMQRIYTLS